MNENKIFTNRENEVIKKKFSGRSLTQQDSNYLSRYVRPKLRGISSIDAKLLLDKLEYNQKAASIEKKIKKLILKHIKNVESIILYGSVIQTNWKNYRDVDILIIVRKAFWSKLSEKYRKISEIKKGVLNKSINLDIGIYDKKTLEENYPHSPTLIYQLKDSKVIYGKMSLPKEKKIYKLDLRMKLDWSFVESGWADGTDIYRAIRNLILVRLLLKKIVDNEKLKELLNEEFGKSLIERLKNNKQSNLDKKFALSYLNSLLEKTEEEIKREKWEKIEL
ncbi:hypothetical protein COV15_02950 [Candidatus Woesearchaeota archaeon CG10_big_fil_rev_8_21_14_0_10_34_12]|nr:MAG: hypothetical protein COV15_02950 [Candidatus Woesearchaeota archaeon CG10_big_fil_rev_8_21_14_0_10_34_12]